jgi:hypothetical protein
MSVRFRQCAKRRSKCSPGPDQHWKCTAASSPMPKSSAVYSGSIDDSSMSLNSSRTSRREKNEERLAVNRQGCAVVAIKRYSRGFSPVLRGNSKASNQQRQRCAEPRT